MQQRKLCQTLCHHVDHLLARAGMTCSDGTRDKVLRIPIGAESYPVPL